MDNTFYYIVSCDCCRKIIKTLPEKAILLFHDIQISPLKETEIDQLATMAGSYEALFNKKAVQYRTLNLKDANLSEADYKHYLNRYYSFLKHPIIVINNKIHTKNSPKNTLEILNILK